ncbi:CHAT domain-containing protein [Mycena capillaripes]|nr:CHAT domain-containing protein [Mycena capillaripes]
MESNTPPGSADPPQVRLQFQASELVALADSILRDYMAASSLVNLHTAIYLLAQTWVNEGPQDSECLNLLATALLTRFSYTGQWTDVNIAGILALETAAAQVTWGHDRRGYVLCNLGTGLLRQFETRGSPQDLDNAIGLHHEAVDLQPAPHPGRGSALNSLGNGLNVRFRARHDVRDLDSAIELHREALDLHAALHPDRVRCLIYLGNVLHERFQTRGDAGDLDSAIELHREALDLRPAPNPYRGRCLIYLGDVLHERFRTRGDAGDLDNSIALHREALDLRPAPNPKRYGCLNNLAVVLYTRFQTRGDAGDLDRAIELHREALDLRPAPHPDRGMSLNNLGAMLHEQFLTRGDARHLDGSIELHCEALDLHSTPHPNRGGSLTNLGNALYERFKRRGDAGDLDRAIELHREALDLHPVPHPNRGSSLTNLANGLDWRFKTRGDAGDLDNTIKLCHEAQVVVQPPHPYRGMVLRNLAARLILKYSISLDCNTMEDGIVALRESAGYLLSPVSDRFKAATTWAQHADKYNHGSALEAYETSVELLPQQAMLGLDIQSRQQALKLRSTIGLATDAAACAFRLNEIGKAIELLEAGRSVFWSQALQLHPSLDQLEKVHPELAERIRNISKKLEVGSHRTVASIRMLPAVHKDHMMLDKDDAYYRKLNAEWLETLDEVRRQPGFQRFLQPKLIDELRAAASNGPIVILNASKSSCTALILTRSGGVQAINLANMTWDRAQLLVDLLRAVLNRSDVQIIQILTKIPCREVTTQVSSLKERILWKLENSEHHNPNKVFGWLLEELWTLLVQPVFHALELKKSDHPSRLWWCPTGPLTFLPIHAAGLYRPHETDCVSDYVVSSYTHTLTTLLNPPTQTVSPFKMMAVIQPTTNNCSDLPATVKELARIKQQVPSEWLTSLGDTTPATVDVALQHLQESSVVHFACHGTQDLQNPLETGLLLTDGRLKVSELMRGKSEEKTMTFAFLSACETAKGDDAMPDEAMHLAATLLFAGFRSVVATMWTMADLDGPNIAEKFYQNLFKGCDTDMGPPNLMKAAESLHIAVAKLRADPNVPFSRWVPFVHYGL